MPYFDCDEEDDFKSREEKTEWGLKNVNALGLYACLQNIIKKCNIDPIPSREKDFEIAQRGKPNAVTFKK